MGKQDIDPKIESQVAIRWTPDLATAWTPVSDAFLNYYRELTITPAEAMFIILLMSYKWDKEAPYPGFKVLAKKMGVTMTAARGYARSLENKKLLRREVRVDDTNIFHLDPLFAALEEKVSKEPKKTEKGKTSKRIPRREVNANSAAGQ